MALSLTGRALRLLAIREHSRAELVRKLARYEEEPGSLERVLDQLQAKDFISEARVVDPQAVAAAVGDLQATELARAQAVWHKKFAGVVASDPAGRARQMRFLAARGFGGETIRSVLRQAGQGPGLDAETDG